MSEKETHKEKRMKTFEMYKQFIEDIKKNKKYTKRGYLGYFQNYLIRIPKTTFKEEEEEYRNIGKFGRGIWDTDNLKQYFTEKEIDTIKNIAQGYGAFDY